MDDRDNDDMPAKDNYGEKDKFCQKVAIHLTFVKYVRHLVKYVIF